MLLPQRHQQIAQAVMVDLVHQRQQPSQLPRRKPFACEPRQVIPWQVGNDPSLVFAKRHAAGNQQFKHFRFHRRSLAMSVRRPYCNLHDHPSGNHA